MAARSTQLITATDFISVPTRDIEAASRFYGDTLGLPRSVYLPERHFAEFETGNLTLSIINAERMGLEYEPNKNYVALHVEDIEAARKALEERGVTFNGEILNTGVCHMAFFADPDGNRLMLHHRYMPRETETDSNHG
jgi:predicted enzyme related to lactoylglutathione lyase